jgi:hypothetical protein
MFQMLQYVALKYFMLYVFRVIRRVKVAGSDGGMAWVPKIGRDKLGADGRGAWRASVLRTGRVEAGRTASI